jgi:hypothetical protein
MFQLGNTLSAMAPGTHKSHQQDKKYRADKKAAGWRNSTTIPSAGRVHAPISSLPGVGLD